MAAEPKPKPKRLGRGLSALIGEVEGVSAYSESDDSAGSTSPPRAEASTIPIADIRPNPQQPRRHFGEAELSELAESIRAKGVLQAILVRPDPKDASKYQIIAGERRWRAAKQAGLKDIPATIRNLDELELLDGPFMTPSSKGAPTASRWPLRDIARPKLSPASAFSALRYACCDQTVPSRTNTYAAPLPLVELSL